MTTQADQQLLDRIKNFDTTPRTIELEEPATLLRWRAGEWNVERVLSLGTTVRINPLQFPVRASPADLRRIADRIPPPPQLLQRWNVQVTFDDGTTDNRQVEAETSSLAVYLAGATAGATGVMDTGVEPVNVLVREAL